MRITIQLVLSVLLLSQISTSQTTKPSEYLIWAPDYLITLPFEEISEAKTVDLSGLVEKDRPAVLSRIQQLPKLTRLEFRNCDLSKITETDPVPGKVTAVLIADSKITQGTIGWLSKFPAGTTLVFGCDVSGLKFDLGNFKWLTFDNCKVSRSAVVKLVEQMSQVTFKEVTLTDGP